MAIMSNTSYPATGRLLKISEVVRETSLHRATIYRAIAAGTFPRPCQLGPKRVAWPEAAIEAWKAQLRPACTPPS